MTRRRRRPPPGRRGRSTSCATGRWWCSPAPGCRPTPASPTTAARAPGADADDLPGVRVRAGGAAALLGAQPPRLGPDAAAPSPTPATARSPGLDPELLITQNVDGLHERGRLARGWSRCTAGSPTSSAWTAGRSRRGPRCRQRLADAQPRLRRAARRRSRCARTATSSSTTPRDFVVAGCDGCGGRAQAGRGVLRRERPGAAGGALLRRGRRAGRAAAGRCWSPARA